MNCNNDEQQNISISPSLTVEDDKPFEIPITLDLISERTLDERKLYEIKDSNVIARISEVVPALTNIVARTVTNKGLQSVGEVYRVIIPSGATLSKSKNLEGAVRGFYSNGKGIAGQANLVKINPAQLSKASKVANGVANVMNVASLVVGQYYMSEVNDKLQTMNKSISEIGDFQQREFKSKIFSLITRVGKISKFSSDILENVVNTILKEADLFCPNSVRINFTIYHTKRNIFCPFYFYQMGSWRLRKANRHNPKGIKGESETSPFSSNIYGFIFCCEDCNRIGRNTYYKINDKGRLTNER